MLHGWAVSLRHHLLALLAPCALLENEAVRDAGDAEECGWAVVLEGHHGDCPISNGLPPVAQIHVSYLKS